MIRARRSPMKLSLSFAGGGIHGLRAKEGRMKRHITNAMYGALTTLPIPRNASGSSHHPAQTRCAEYGLWMVSTAVVSAGSIIASGSPTLAYNASSNRTARMRPGRRGHNTHQGLHQSSRLRISDPGWDRAPYAAKPSLSLRTRRGQGAGTVLFGSRVS